jgi:hypothetical protein
VGGRDTCVSNYRVIEGPCWGANFPIGPNSPIILNGIDSGINPMQPGVGLVTPCSFETCCLDYYKVCIVNHMKQISWQTGQPGVCDPNDPPQCVPVCNN